MARQTFHFNTSPLVNHCDTTPQKTTDDAIQAQLFRSITQLPPSQRNLIRRLVENLKLLAESAPKDPAAAPQKPATPLVSVGPSGLNGRFQAEY